MHNSNVKCSRVIYFFPDVGLPGVRCRNIFSSNNPNDSQIACLSLVKNLLMMRVEGAPCLLVADDSPVYKEKQREKIIMFPPNHSSSWNPTTLEHLNKPLLSGSLAFPSLLPFWSVKSTFITITIKFPFSNSTCTYAKTGISIGKKLDMIGTRVEAQALHAAVASVQHGRICSIQGSLLHLSYEN